VLTGRTVNPTTLFLPCTVVVEIFACYIHHATHTGVFWAGVNKYNYRRDAYLRIPTNYVYTVWLFILISACRVTNSSSTKPSSNGISQRLIDRHLTTVTNSNIPLSCPPHTRAASDATKLYKQINLWWTASEQQATRWVCPQSRARRAYPSSFHVEWFNQPQTPLYTVKKISVYPRKFCGEFSVFWRNRFRICLYP